jgi:uroporphyrinogen decarboxylase
MAMSGANVLSIDWRVDLTKARERVGDQLTLQGNLDPCVLLSTPEIIDQKARELVRAGSGHRHILNLGHGILPMTPVENARAFIDAAKNVQASSEST